MTTRTLRAIQRLRRHDPQAHASAEQEAAARYAEMVGLNMTPEQRRERAHRLAEGAPIRDRRGLNTG